MSVRVRLVFPEELVRRPVIAMLVRDFGVEPNIRRANVEEREGWIVCEIAGDRQAIDAAVEWLGDIGVRVEPLGDVFES